MYFKINEPINFVFLGKTIYLFVFMLPDSFHKVRGYADVERAVHMVETLVLRYAANTAWLA